MRYMSDLEDWNNRSQKEIDEDNEKASKALYDDLVAQRDKLQNEIRQAYESLRNSSTETGENASEETVRATEIVNLEKQLNGINSKIANFWGSQSDVETIRSLVVRFMLLGLNLSLTIS